jgi:hypothetical protein
MAPRASSAQIALPLVIERERDVGGVGMGVLSDGTPFLTQRGLAVLCGVENAHIGTISRDWNRDPPTPRVAKIKAILADRNDEKLNSAHVKVPGKSGDVFAYSDTVCLAVLEWYAFEAGQQLQPEALKNFRRLAGQKLRELIYREVGYKPEPAIPLAVQQFLDRVTANHEAVPVGFFSVFKELAGVIMTLIQAGANFGPEFVPDISVGQHWSKHWIENEFEGKYGKRLQYEHNYPPYFPQAETNPQPAYCYPDTALAEFKVWMHEVYLQDLIRPYLKGAEKRGKLPKAFADVAMQALASRPAPKRLT